MVVIAGLVLRGAGISEARKFIGRDNCDSRELLTVTGVLVKIFWGDL